MGPSCAKYLKESGMDKSIGSWKGKPVEEHTKKELLVIIGRFARSIKRHREYLQEILDALEGKPEKRYTLKEIKDTFFPNRDLDSLRSEITEGMRLRKAGDVK